MYKLVRSSQELQVFDGIWTKAWEEKGFELEFSERVMDRVLVYDEQNMPVGTVEIKPYFPGKSMLDQVAPFDKIPLLHTCRDSLGEVDKVALQREYRGKNINRLLLTMMLYAEQHGIQYYVSLLDPILYRALRISFHLPMDRVGKRVYYKGADVVPVIIRAREIYEHKEEFDWVQETLREPLTQT